MNRIFLLLLAVMIALLALAGGAAAQDDSPTGADNPAALHEVRLGPGFSFTGYMINPDDYQVLDLIVPDGMTIRPRIEVAPGSSLRLKAQLDFWPSVQTDDSCDDSTITFEVTNPDSAVGELTLQPCPGTLDIDKPYRVFIDYDPILTEDTPGPCCDDYMLVDPDDNKPFLTYHGSLVPDLEQDHYRLWDVLEGEHMTVTLTPEPGTFSPKLLLSGPGGVQIIRTNCNGSTTVACLDYTFPLRGDYLLKVDSGLGPVTGDYTLVFDFGPDVAGEPDNSIADLDEWHQEGHYTGLRAIWPANDVDYSTLTGHSVPGTIYRISLELPAGIGLSRVAVDVVDASDTVLESDILTKANPFIDFSVQAAGPHYLRARDADAGAGDPDAIYYRLKAERIGPYVSSDLDGFGGLYGHQQGDLPVMNDDSGYDPTWRRVFDASRYGLTRDVTAAEFLPNGTLLLSLDAPQKVQGLGTVTPFDIIRFVPDVNDWSYGPYTGHFEWFLDGSDVGLTASGERIDAINLSSTDPDSFTIAISLTGSGTVPKQGGGTLTVADEDLIRLVNPSFGPGSAGKWALHMDGSAVRGMAAEDVRGATLLDATSTRSVRGGQLLVFEGVFNVAGFSGDNRDFLLAWLGQTPTDVQVQGITADNFGNKKIDAVTIGPARPY